jgi:protein SCO1/2
MAAQEGSPASASPTLPLRRGTDLCSLLALLALLSIAGVSLLSVGCGSQTSAGAVHQATPSTKYSGSLASPAVPEPPLALRNYTGERINVAEYRGKAVLVTFLYTHCPDQCPLIAANLGVALNLMGPAKASKVQVIAVSVDPRGDTSKSIAKFLKSHGVMGRMQYLVGSKRKLAKVWKAWGVGSERDASNPELINHSGLVYGVSAQGKLTTLYAANFKPTEIVHDAPLLASS